MKKVQSQKQDVKSKPEINGVQEPTRRTLFDRIKDNLKLVDRVTYLHRVIYVGSHNIPENLLAVISNTIEVEEEHCNREPLTGFLLAYNKYFIHMVEGDEDSIHHHIEELLAVQKENPKGLPNIKLVVQVSHVLKRMCHDWLSYEGLPAQLLTKIEDKTLEDTARQVYNCVRKFYMLVNHFLRDLITVDADTEPRISSFASRESSNKSYPSRSAMYPENSLISLVRGSAMAVRDPYRSYLPEREVLQFLLESDFTMPLKEYHELYFTIPQREVYKDKVWPTAGDLIPFDVFSTPYEMGTELPKPDSTSQRKEETVPDVGSLEEESAEEEEEGAEEETIEE
ncbi:unnamed protein product [Callosobruchus maculatus]|uniref:BLUF domain-containing protein n=1 Tax=Callosobruchus maculatus TaxID=64391 RepID=A0A653CTP5_CALMS|nr:unnamed protein product [Callosobruchus maculatus]